MHISRRTFARSIAGMSALKASSAMAPERVRPKLLVWIVVEQFRPDYLDRNEALLGKGGLRRLIEEGAYFPDCRMASSSFTSTGLATLATGAWPQSHGIVADNWYDTATRRLAHASVDALAATSLADQIGQDPRSRIFAVGLDREHTAFLAGRNPAGLFAMDARGEFAAHGTAAVPWFGAFQKANPVEGRHNAQWLALGARAGSPPLRVLKFDPARPQQFTFLYQASPFAQAVQFELVRELVEREKLGQGGGIDYLMLVPASSALLAYDVGSDSPLVDQIVRHLDREIEQTLETLNRIVGAGNYGVILTAAHGAPMQPSGRTRRALAGDTVARALDKTVGERFKGSAVDRYVYPFVYLRSALADRRPLRAAAAQAALDVPGVAGYFTADGDCSHGGEWLRRFRNSFHARRSGDLMLSYAPGWVEEYGAGRGVTYGSLYDYDCRVPLILYGWQFRGEVFERPVEAIDVAPTVARVAGLSYPSSATGRVLWEALAPAPRERK